MAGGLVNIFESVSSAFFKTSKLSEVTNLRSHLISVTGLLLGPPLCNGMWKWTTNNVFFVAFF